MPITDNLCARRIYVLELLPSCGFRETENVYKVANIQHDKNWRKFREEER